MNRKRLNLNTPSKIIIGIVAGTATYEVTAAILNKNFGVGLPYFPWQVTPSTAAAAAMLYGTATIGCVGVSLM